MRPNEYEVVEQKFREERENERSERGERSDRSDRGERSRDRDYDRGDRYGKILLEAERHLLIIACDSKCAP